MRNRRRLDRLCDKWLPLRLEGDPQTGLEGPVHIDLHALCALRRRDLAESGVTDIGVRLIEPRSVTCIERFGAELHFQPLSDVELAENRAVDVEQVRTV